MHLHSISKSKFKVHNINHSTSLAPLKLIKVQVRKGGSPRLSSHHHSTTTNIDSTSITAITQLY